MIAANAANPKSQADKFGVQWIHLHPGKNERLEPQKSWRFGWNMMTFGFQGWAG